MILTFIRRGLVAAVWALLVGGISAVGLVVGASALAIQYAIGGAG